MGHMEYAIRRLGQLRTEALRKEAKEERMAKLALREEQRSDRALLHFLPRCFHGASLSEPGR